MLAGHRLSLVLRVCVILLSKLGRENMRLYRNDSNTLYLVSNNGRTDK